MCVCVCVCACARFGGMLETFRQVWFLGALCLPLINRRTGTGCNLGSIQWLLSVSCHSLARKSKGLEACAHLPRLCRTTPISGDEGCPWEAAAKWASVGKINKKWLHDLLVMNYSTLNGFSLQLFCKLLESCWDVFWELLECFRGGLVEVPLQNAKALKSGAQELSFSQFTVTEETLKIQEPGRNKL